MAGIYAARAPAAQEAAKPAGISRGCDRKCIDCAEKFGRLDDRAQPPETGRLKLRKDGHFSGALLFVLCAAALCAPVSARAQDSTRESPIVVEMFLSQACKQCPPAANYLNELRQRSDLVVLTWHIDYWNLLSNKKHGRWKDPYSSPDFAARQRIYNRKIRERGTVFTPQAIISGAGSAVGSKADAIEEIIALSRPLQRPAEFQFVREENVLAVTINVASTAYYEVFLVTFKDYTVTEIKGGDNAGLTFREPNVVTGMTRLGAIAHRSETFRVAAPAEGMGCAVLVQERQQGAILAASYCP
jgi:hypothetical protein